MSQKVLIVETIGASLRSDIDSWSCEDSSKFVPNKPIGLTPDAGPMRRYYTVLEALSDGWKLLAPPTVVDADDNTYEWWLVA